MTSFDISSLQPSIVWNQFAMLCRIPRPSKQEHVLRDHILAWAQQLELETQVDAIGNVVIRKPATTGREDRPGVILQGHLDMVTQANRNTIHDFNRDPIQAVLEDGWLIAKNTTLGADNGIGVALALAVLESQTLEHGPIEVLLTVDEEAGMSGARELASDMLQGQWLFNMDTEEWGELYLGCAGSQDVELSKQTAYITAPSHASWFEIQVHGLKGGHSGVDIHLGRGNANVILAQLLHHLTDDIYVAEFIGGTARNAIPREAHAIIAIDPQHVNALEQQIEQHLRHWHHDLQQIDDGLKIELTPVTTAPQHVMSQMDQHAWLSALATCPYGIDRMSDVLDDVVETSNNIGMIALTQASATAKIMVRSMVNAEAAKLAQHIVQHFQQHHIDAELTPLVSGWTPNPQSAALQCLQRAYQTAFHIEPQLKVIHAGLECGIIAEHYPHLEMVSFGPDIQGAHAPGERVRVESVAHCWQLLTAALLLVE